MLCHMLSLLGTDVLKGDPLGLLDITDEVNVTNRPGFLKLLLSRKWFLDGKTSTCSNFPSMKINYEKLLYVCGLLLANRRVRE